MRITVIPFISILAAVPNTALAGGLAATADTVAAPVVAAPAPQSDWTGLYVGAQIGNLSYQSFATLPPLAGNRLFDGEGPIAGLHAGYMHDFGTLVLGGEADVNFGDVDLDLATGAASSFTVDRSTMLKARVGVDLGRVLPYAVGGYGWHDVDNTLGPEQAFRGALYGLGVSFLVTDRVMVGTEILHHDLDAYEPSSNTQRAEITTVSLRASWRF
jgi:opacity protein-like surface antigen